MRAFEFLTEDYNNDLETDLNNLLVSAKGSGATSVQLPKIINQLRNSGYAVGIEGIMNLLQDNPMVLNITDQEVTLDTDNPAMDSEPTDSDMSTPNDQSAHDSSEKVSGLAQNAVDI